MTATKNSKAKNVRSIESSKKNKLRKINVVIITHNSGVV